MYVIPGFGHVKYKNILVPSFQDFNLEPVVKNNHITKSINHESLWCHRNKIRLVEACE